MSRKLKNDSFIFDKSIYYYCNQMWIHYHNNLYHKCRLIILHLTYEKLGMFHNLCNCNNIFHCIYSIGNRMLIDYNYEEFSTYASK